MQALRLALAAAIATVTLSAQTTTLDRVYTEAQAERGMLVYRANCIPCHGEFLQGKPDPSLKGDGFIDRWREDNLNSLYTHIRTRMPPRLAGSGRTGGLGEANYLDLVAFLLHENEFPAGSQELTAKSVLEVQFVSKDGPKPLPSNAQATIVGCFTAGANQSWMLTRATEPLRSRSPEEISTEETAFSQVRPLGNGNFRLRNLDEWKPDFDWNTWKGRRVIVKGVLIRQTGNDRLTVLTAAATAVGCGD